MTETVTHKCFDAEGLVEAGKARVSRMVDHIHPDDYTTWDFYSRFKAAWSSVTFTVVTPTMIRATVADPDFHHIASEALDVDMCGECYTNGRIEDHGDRSALLRWEKI